MLYEVITLLGHVPVVVLHEAEQHREQQQHDGRGKENLVAQGQFHARTVAQSGSQGHCANEQWRAGKTPAFSCFDSGTTRFTYDRASGGQDCGGETGPRLRRLAGGDRSGAIFRQGVITSYSIHYTKLYEGRGGDHR